MPEIVKIHGMGRYFSHTVSEFDEGREVLSYLKNELALSTRKIKSVKYAEKGILLDGVRVNVREKLHKGQNLLVMLDDVTPSCECLIEYDYPFNILYEDDDLIFIEKPSGLVCHPSQGHYADSLANAVCTHLRKRGDKASLHLIGRLDKDTSGIVGFAKNSVVHERMERLREEGSFFKEYLALVWGKPEEDEADLDFPMKEIPTPEGNHTFMVLAEPGEGKHASTHYKLVKSDGIVSLVRVTIRTGRTHQIRFHMSHLGHPLVGDATYGGESYLEINRAALHAETVSFKHPITGEELSFSATIPDDMKNAIIGIEK